MRIISTSKIPALSPVGLCRLIVWLFCLIPLQPGYAANLHQDTSSLHNDPKSNPARRDQNPKSVYYASDTGRHLPSLKWKLLCDKLENFISDQDAVLVADPSGRVLFSKNAERQLIPASTLKIFTALTALRYLGPDYRFTTEFYLDQDNNLIVKGYGDPLLISEVLEGIAAELAAHLGRKQNHIKDLVLDDSYFEEPIIIPGVSSTYEPYDAPNGALCANFNTVHFKRNKIGDYVSAEPQTPLLPFVVKRIRSSGLRQGRIIFTRKGNESTLYAGHLLLYFMKQHGIHSSGRVRTGLVQKETDRLIYSYVSGFSMEQVIAKLLEYSSNFMANQLFVATGAHVYGPPGTLHKGVLAASMFAKDVLNLDTIKLVEGSGISRENRISAQNLHIILEAFLPYRHLMRREGRAFFKTGTLNGIKTRAGYIENMVGGLYRFVVVVNTPGKAADHIMDMLLQGLD